MTIVQATRGAVRLPWIKETESDSLIFCILIVANSFTVTFYFTTEYCSQVEYQVGPLHANSSFVVSNMKLTLVALATLALARDDGLAVCMLRSLPHALTT